MAFFAGPVFPEWYWGPIFFAILFGPPLLAVALGVDWLLRRRGVRLSWPRRTAVAATTVALGVAGILGAGALRDHLRLERESRLAARSIDFTPLVADELPSGLHTARLTASTSTAPHLSAVYEDSTVRYAYGLQQRPVEVSLAAGRCDIRGLAGVSTSFYEGPCRMLRSPAGREVYDAPSSRLTVGRESYALLEGTLVRLEHVGLGEAEMLAYFDALRPVDRREIDFKGP